MSFYITGFTSYLPEKRVTNEELAPVLGVSPEWIEENSGIRERRWVSSEESSSSLAAEAVQRMLEKLSLPAEKVDYLIACTMSPDYQVPGIAPLVQHKVRGLRNIPAIDIRAACSSFLYAVQLAGSLANSDYVVCFGTEAQSKALDLSPKSAEVSMLFGDGAGACLVSREMLPNKGLFCLKVEDIEIATDGSFAEELLVRAPGTANGGNWLDGVSSGLHFGAMNGRTVILQAVKKLTDSASKIVSRNGLSFGDIKLLIPHQANGNLLRALGKKLGIDAVVSTVAKYGNTSSASLFIALAQVEEEKRLKPEELGLIVAFGAGFTWGAMLVRAI